MSDHLTGEAVCFKARIIADKTDGRYILPACVKELGKFEESGE